MVFSHLRKDRRQPDLQQRLPGNLRAVVIPQQKRLWSRKVNGLFWEAPAIVGRMKSSKKTRVRGG